MRTPYGAECKFYYADFNRGRNVQECRLPRVSPGRWSPDLCQRCPVPRFLLANSCPHLIFTGKIDDGLLGLGRKITVTATCHKDAGVVSLVTEPAIGCGHCHEALAPLKFTLPE